MIKLEISKDKKELKIVLLNKEEFIEKYGNDNPYPEIWDLLEDSGYLGNGYFDLTDQVGLTSSPIIGYDIDIDDKGNFVEGDVYWYPDYQVINPFRILLEQGKVVFVNSEN